MPISVKNSGAYASAPLFYVKKSGTYSPAQGVYVKRSGAYSNASTALYLDFLNSNRTLDSRITFSRASNATMTGNDGLLRYGRHNLLTYSEQFDNAAWTKARASITANATTAPDGATTADKLVEDSTAANTHLALQSFTFTAGTTYTYSVYAKAAERSTVRLVMFDGTTSYAGFFNLSAGTVGSLVGGATASIQSAGNGWYRCAIAATVGATATGSATVRLSVAEADTYNGDGASGAFLWGAQLEINRNASIYVPTTTAAVYGPRFDYDPITLAPRGLLIEEQRANLFLYSEQFDNAAWSPLGPITVNAAVAPNGITTADKLSDPTDTYTGRVYQTVTVAAGTDYVMSAFVKAGDATTGRIAITDPVLNFSLAVYADFDLSAGTISAPTNAGGTWTGATSSITAVGNGWYRVTVGARLVGNTSVFAGLHTSASYIGVGTGYYIWGAQIEAGTFATSYIPTLSATVTRSADSAIISGANFSSWYGATEGTLVVEADSSTASATARIVSFNPNSASNKIDVVKAASNQVQTLMSADGAVTSVNTVTLNTRFKVAAAFAQNALSMSLNGAAAVTDSTATMGAPTQLNIGSTSSAGVLSSFLNGHVRNVAYYTTRLTDAELRALSA